MDPFIGEIRAFCFHYVPFGWEICDGRMLPVRQNTALFSVIGNRFGGDGIDTFALPDLSGRAPMGVGKGHGLTPRSLGERTGSVETTLGLNHLPRHDHAVSGVVTAITGNMRALPETDSRISRVVEAATAIPMYSKRDEVNLSLSGRAAMQNGGGQPHENRQPFLSMNYCIALKGSQPLRS